MRTASSKDRMRSGNNSDFSAFLLGAASQAAHFFPLCLNAEAGWMRYQRFRSLGVFLILAAFCGLLASHLWLLQFDPSISEANLSEIQRRWHSYDEPLGKRGNILFRDGTLLAGNRKVARVLVEPELLDPDKQGALVSLLCGITGQRAESIARQLAQPGRQGLQLAQGLSLEEALRIKQAGLPGVFIRYYYERNYPHGEFGAAASVGYAGREKVHRTGLEAYWEKQLSGHNGKVTYARDRHSRRLPQSIGVQEPRPGIDLTTTLDPAVQLICETELRQALKENNSEWACIVAMEPLSGELRGVATWPTFDPNKYVRGEIASELNVLTQRVFEPGSTVKPLLVAQALDKAWLPQGKRYVCTRHLTINGYTVREAELDEVIGDKSGASLEDIIVHSSNIGMAQLALDLGQRRVLEAYSSYGFFQPSGIEQPSESKGLRPYGGRNSAWPRITLANTGFGQGMAVTPLQLASAYCALANGGYRVHPTLVLNTAAGPQPPEAPQGSQPEPQLPQGETLLAGLGIGLAQAADAPSAAKGSGLPVTLAKESERILSVATCRLLGKWLAEVVADGTGKKAQLERYNAAGKTGTAQVPARRGGYETGSYTSSFAGYFPAENPRYVVVVIFGRPRGGYYGGAVAAPVFKRVSDRISFLQSGEFAGLSHAAR